MTKHIIQPLGGGVIRQVWVGGHQPSMGRGSSANCGGCHQPSMGRGVIRQVWVGGHQQSMGRGVINQVWMGGHQPTMGGGTIMQQWGIGVSVFPPVCTGTQNPQNYFSNTYVLPSVDRTAGPMRVADTSMKVTASALTNTSVHILELTYNA